MHNSIVKIVVTILVILLVIPGLFAQEKEKKATPYWYVLSSTVNWERVDSLQTLYDDYIFPVKEEAIKTGKILDYKLLIHHTGDIYNIVVMTKFPSWCAMEKGWFSAIFKSIESDKDKRKAYYDGFYWVFEDSQHFDNIYTEL